MQHCMCSTMNDQIATDPQKRMSYLFVYHIDAVHTRIACARTGVRVSKMIGAGA